MKTTVDEVKKDKVLHRFEYNHTSLVAQIIAGIIFVLTSAYLISNYMSEMKTSIWKTNSYVAEKNMKTLFLIFGILMFGLAVICFIKVPAMKKSYLSINSKGIFGIAGKSYYFSTESFTIPFDQITNLYIKGNSIYIESGGENYRVNIELAGRAESIINNHRTSGSSDSDSRVFHNISLDSTSKEAQPNPNEWKCPVCGRINQNYVGTCGCGNKKTEM